MNRLSDRKSGGARPSATGSRAAHRANSSVVSTEGFDPARKPSEPLNPDAFAFMVLQREYREQMNRHAMLCERSRNIRADLDRADADALTAAERATSIMETLLKLDPPCDASAIETEGGDVQQAPSRSDESATGVAGDARP